MTDIEDGEIDMVSTFRVDIRNSIYKNDDLEQRKNTDLCGRFTTQALHCPSARVLMTITEDAITTKQEYTGLNEEMSYRVTSERADQITVELSVADDRPTISVLRIVEGGLAFQEGESGGSGADLASPKWFYLKRRE